MPTAWFWIFGEARGAVMMGAPAGVETLTMWRTLPVKAVRKAVVRGVQLTMIDWHLDEI
jgi:hypothetical protein